MLDALNDEDENVKASAIEHLGRMGEASVVDRLIEVLNNHDFRSRYLSQVIEILHPVFQRPFVCGVA